MLDLVVHPGLPDDEPVDVDTKVPDQWEMIKCMKIKLKDINIEGTSTIFCLNNVIAEIESSGPFRLIPPRTSAQNAGRLLDVSDGNCLDVLRMQTGISGYSQ